MLDHCFDDNTHGIGKIDKGGLRIDFLDFLGQIQRDRQGAHGIGESARPEGVVADHVVFKGEGFVAHARLNPAHANVIEHVFGIANGLADIGARHGFGGKTGGIKQALAELGHKFQFPSGAAEQNQFLHVEVA